MMCTDSERRKTRLQDNGWKIHLLPEEELRTDRVRLEKQHKSLPFSPRAFIYPRKRLNDERNHSS
jgi:hypothetical protein